MIPSEKEIDLLLKKYAPNEKYLRLVSEHGSIVAEIALWCAKNTSKIVDLDVLYAACRLHDIGSYVYLGAENHDESFARNYPAHAITGAKILQDEGLDVRIWKAVETHVLLGLSEEDIKDANFALPFRDYEPETIEAKLLCYADRFHSKKPTFNDYSNFLKKLESSLPRQARKLEDMAAEFGIPNIQKLAVKYSQSVR